MDPHAHHHDEPEEVQSWAGDFDPFADPEERRVLFSTLDSFRQYRRTAHMNTTHRRRQAFYALPSSHWQMLAEAPFNLLDNFNKVDDAIDANAELADAILKTGLESFGLSANPEEDDPTRNWQGTATSSDVSKAHSTIRQFYRDWSAEGKAEREVCYDPVIKALDKEFGQRKGSRSEVKVLVPGAGLGRLVFDLCQAGFAAEGNEISYHQLIASSWVLNHSRGPGEHVLYPFATQFSNLESRTQQLRKVMIPDVHPMSAMLAAQQEQAEGNAEGNFGTMSMSAADFVVLYRGESQKDAFDAVATVFFIDTAPNLIRYIEVIRNCLKPGGIWINVGPLLWHFESSSTRGGKSNEETGANTHQNDGIGEPGSVELTDEEVMLLVERMGFHVEERALREGQRECGYIQDPRSMLQNLYRPSRWIARKKAT
ncbi:putative trehalase [Paecilomyces variotii]|uniref:carnosine N-methyltransferase n=1 Tax=Byssochlamys spectabilis TaxID=264951 RepID=A0A443HVY8_BYSSP|nr:putative trehalase [Paecilomyces variotii]RWQ96005.1 putative trehalase [Paecilomyces variotii]